MKVSTTDLAWLAGIADGEGCFSVKSPIVRSTGKRAGSRTSYQLWFVLCNTSKPMIDRVASILKATGVQSGTMRKVWKGKKATRWQYWIEIARKHDLLRLTEMLLPHLTAKKTEAEVVIWYLRKACAVNQYHASALDIALLNALSDVKRNGGEAPAEIEEMIREVIPSQASAGHRQADDVALEGVETRSVSPNDNPTQECPTSLRLVSQVTKR